MRYNNYCFNNCKRFGDTSGCTCNSLCDTAKMYVQRQFKVGDIVYDNEHDVVKKFELTDYCRLNAIEPISLTPEILSIFGFTFKRVTYHWGECIDWSIKHHDGIVEHQFGLTEMSEYGAFIPSCDGCFIEGISILYVHELQQLMDLSAAFKWCAYGFELHREDI